MPASAPLDLRATHDKHKTLNAILRDVWTHDARGAYFHIAEDPAGHTVLRCWDNEHDFTERRLDLPSIADASTFAAWLDAEIASILAEHRQPWNRMRGHLPSTDAASYYGLNP